MNIENIKGLTFSAIPDLNTRGIIKSANMQGIDTNKLENLIKDIHADKYIITNNKPNGDTTIGIYKKAEGYADLFMPVMKFNRNDDDLYDVITAFSDTLSSIKNLRSKEQCIIDKLENKFGRYDEPDAYKHAFNYLA